MSSEKNEQNKVIVSRGNEVIETIPLGGHMIIGRAAGADIQLEDTALSRIHAMFQKDAGRWFLVDLNSLNGTLLNGRKIALCSRPRLFRRYCRIGRVYIEISN